MPASAPPARRRWMPVWTWTSIGVLLLVAVILLSPVVALLALIVAITSIVGLSRGTRTWLRLGSRRTKIGVTAAAALLFLAASSVSAATLSNSPGTSAEAEPARFADVRPSTRPTPTPVTREEVVTETISFEQATVEDANIPRGQTVVTVAGQSGQRELTYVVTLVGGVETARKLTSEVVTVEPVTQITAVGTYDPPPPPPAPSCHASYADACVPIASDVDCAWGSGDGPAYFDGVARVVGRDVYDLDRDGDGWACER